MTWTRVIHFQLALGVWQWPARSRSRERVALAYGNGDRGECAAVRATEKAKLCRIVTNCEGGVPTKVPTVQDSFLNSSTAKLPVGSSATKGTLSYGHRPSRLTTQRSHTDKAAPVLSA